MAENQTPPAGTGVDQEGQAVDNAQAENDRKAEAEAKKTEKPTTEPVR